MTNSPHTCAGALLEKNGTREKGEETKKKKQKHLLCHNSERPRKGWNESPLSVFSLSMA